MGYLSDVCINGETVIALFARASLAADFRPELFNLPSNRLLEFFNGRQRFYLFPLFENLGARWLVRLVMIWLDVFVRKRDRNSHTPGRVKVEKLLQ
jgi:hypothetical protein